jgi:hypothetical protein
MQARHRQTARPNPIQSDHITLIQRLIKGGKGETDRLQIRHTPSKSKITTNRMAHKQTAKKLYRKKPPEKHFLPWFL